jgi:squalene-hopene/tetraprenyl-beta-curcumene cyclase
MPQSSGAPSIPTHERFAERIFEVELERSIAGANESLLALQHSDGHYRFDLEADCTIPAEYILMMHYMDEIDDELAAKIAVYLREHQCEDGGWNLYCEKFLTGRAP